MIGDMEARMSELVGYLRQHGQIRIREYAQLTGLDKSRAGKELRRFAADGTIKVAGRVPHIYYFLADTGTLGR